MATPYDGKIGIWQWTGQSVTEDTIQDVVDTIKRWAPSVTQMWVKTSDGANWQGTWDNDPDMRIDGVTSIDTWVRVLEENGMEFHAWAVVTGKDPAEADYVIAACKRPGVKSMILDVEPFKSFWVSGREPIRPLMTRIREEVGGDFHIGMAIDPRPQHKPSIYPEEWLPFINSVHLQLYWESFERDVEEVLSEGYATWGSCGLPVFPIFPGSADPEEMAAACKLARECYNGVGMSWWRMGVISSRQFPAVNDSLGNGAQPIKQKRFGHEIVISTDNARFQNGAYEGKTLEELVKTFINPLGFTVKYKPSVSGTSQMWASWDPQLIASGKYEVAAFVPSPHGTTRNARYKIHGVVGNEGEVIVCVDQNAHDNTWVVLGDFEFDANNADSGTIFLSDATGEADREIAFDALRWRQIVGWDEPTDKYLADGFDSPVGSYAERQGDAVWPAGWTDPSGWDQWYDVGGGAWHTGADLNLNTPKWDLDAHQPVYSIASGVVVAVGDKLAGWGTLVVIRHDPLATTGQVVYSRYGHVENIIVKVGDRVVRGEQIASIGRAAVNAPYHLHFDISPTDVLETYPGHWPGRATGARALVRKHYVDPRLFIVNNRPPR